MNKEIKNCEIIARKSKFTFDDGKEVDSLKLIARLDGADVVLTPDKSSKDLAKFVVGFNAMEYDKDYVIYGKRSWLNYIH